MPAPTFGTATNLAEGTGTRALPAVTIAAGGYVVVQVIGEDGVLANVTPSATGLTFTKYADAGASGDTRVQIWVAPDATGGSRTITMTPSNGSRNYRVLATPVAGSGGPGGFASSITGQTVSLARTAANSAIFEQVGDWSTGAVGSPTWTPGGATTLSQQGAAATYIFGRWDDSGATATASHGISSPSYGTPSVAVLEMLGTAGGTTHAGAASGSSVSGGSAAVTLILAAAASGSSTSAGSGAAGRLMAAATVGASASGGSAAATVVPPGPVTYQVAASGSSTSAGSAAVTLRLAATAAGSSTTGGTATAGRLLAALASAAATSAGTALASIVGESIKATSSPTVTGGASTATVTARGVSVPTVVLVLVSAAAVAAHRTSTPEVTHG